jgi:ligand-binding sensor domain-containing protein/signal transduction histidine kinase
VTAAARVLPGVLAAVWALCPSSAVALDPGKSLTQYRLASWQSEKGLPQDTIQALLQTRDGYLWVGTQEGLARFDGFRFRVWDERTTPEFRSGSITSLLEDSRGRLWIGLSGGIARLEGGTFTNLDAGLAQGVTAWSMCETQDGDVWVATSGAGLLRFRGDEKKALTTEDGLPSNDLRSICRDRAGNLWVGTSRKGVFRMREEAITVVDSSNGLSNDVVRAVAPHADGGIWVGTAGGGLQAVRDSGRVEVSRVRGLPTEQVSALHVDRDGTLWVGTWGSGVARVRDGRVEHLSSKNGLSNDQVWSLGSDREGNVWIGTWVGGLNRLADGKFLPIGVPEGLSSDNTRAVLQTRDGALWVATAGGGLNRVESGVVTVLDAADGFGTNEISSLSESADGSLLVGTYTSGAFRVSGRRVTPLVREGRLPSKDVRGLLEARDGSIWIGTAAGAQRLTAGRLEPALPGEPAPPRRVIGFLEDRAETMWIATHEGLFAWAAGRLVKRTTADGLANDRVLALHEDVEGVLWIGTAGGLTRFVNGRLQSLTAPDSLLDDTILGIVDDGLGHLWLTTNRGLSRVRKADLDSFFAGRTPKVPFDAYGTDDGLRSRTFAGGLQPTAIRMTDGRLAFPSYRGAVIVDPRSLRKTPPPPAVVVEEVITGERTFSGAGPFELPAGTRSLEFRYTAPSFVAPAALEFRYELEGVDPGPVEAGSRRRAFYTNLEPGTYTFRVTAKNHDGLSSPGPTVVLVRIPPRFVETWLFKGLLLVALGASGFGLLRLRLAALRRGRDELESVVARRTEDIRQLNLTLETRVQERTSELEGALREMETFTYTVSHDLRAPLRAIDGFAAMLLEDASSALDQEGRRRLGVVRASSQRMGRLIDDLLTHTRIGRGPLRLAHVDMEALVRRAWTEIQRDGSTGTGAELRIGSLPAGQGDPELLLRVWKELLANAAKFSSKSPAPVIEVAGEESGDETIYRVRDNGAGFDMAYSGKLFGVFQRLHSESEFAGLGVGLAIVQRIVARHGGRVEAEGAVGDGAAFTFRLPRRPQAGGQVCLLHSTEIRRV